MKINELAQPRRSQGAAAVFESYFGGLPVDRMSHRQARQMLGRVRGMLAEHRSTREFHMSENNPAYLKLVMLEGVLRQKLNEAEAAPTMGMMNPSSPEAKKAMQDQAAKVKQAQMQQINKVKDPNIKNALSSAIQGKSMNPDQQQALASAALASGAVSEDSSSWMVKAKTAEGQTKSFRVRAGSEKEARSKFSQHHNQAKIISVSAEQKLDELSKDTLKSYLDKSYSDNYDRKQRDQVDWQWHGDGEHSSPDIRDRLSNNRRKIKNRDRGFDQAADRLKAIRKREVDDMLRGNGMREDQQLDELSKDTLKSYAKKAKTDMAVQAAKWGSGRHEKTPLDTTRKLNNRDRGIDRAIDKLANESIRHSLRRALTESELNQAQVVLAAKDLGDRVQKMLEDASSMQFKDLPALVDEIRSEVGVPQSGQYSQQVGEILGTLVQSIQQAKSGLDQAMGIVTGQEMSVPGEPGADLSGAAPAPEMGAELPPEAGAPPAGGMEMPPEAPPEEPGAEAPGALGRERR